MRPSHRILTLLAVLALTALPARADEIFSLKAGYQTLSPSGTFAAVRSGIGTHIDLEHDLPYDDSQGLTAEAALQFGAVRIAGGYLPLSFSGQGTLHQAIDFNGQTFTAGTVVASDVDLKLYDLAATLYLVNFDDLPVRFQLGPEVAVKIVAADLSFSDHTTGIKESASSTAAIPTVGGRLRVGFADYLGLVGRVGYLKYSDNSFLDAEAQVEFSPLPMVGLYGGYRYFDLKIDAGEVLVDANFSGPFVGALVRF